MRLDRKHLEGRCIGVSVGSSNIRSIDTVVRAIDDYLETFSVLRDQPYVRYFELNVSCPNAAMSESFTDPRHFDALAGAVALLHLRQPVFMKMPNEIDLDRSDALVRAALRHDIRGFIFSNLVKDRNNLAFDREEIVAVAGWKGGFSGKPTAEHAQTLITHARQTFGGDVALVSCGGIFGSFDAVSRLAAGADLLQVITGMIYEGPQVIGEITRVLAEVGHAARS